MAESENENKITLRNKTVFPSEPYSPREEYFNRFIGREPELGFITASWIGSDFSLPMSPLLIGDPGMGKNRLIYELTQKTGRQLFIFQGHEDVTSEDLACTVRFPDQSERYAPVHLQGSLKGDQTSALLSRPEARKL